MNFAKLLGKNKNKIMNVILLLGVVFVVGLLLKYNSDKSAMLDNMTGKNHFSNVGLVESDVPSRTKEIREQLM